MAPIVSLGRRMEKETLGKHCKHPSLLIFSVWVRAPNVPEKADRMFVFSFGLRQQELSDRESLRYLSHLKKQLGRAAEFLGKWKMWSQGIKGLLFVSMPLLLAHRQDQVALLVTWQPRGVTHGWKKHQVRATKNPLLSEWRGAALAQLVPMVLG